MLKCRYVYNVAISYGEIRNTKFTIYDASILNGKLLPFGDILATRTEVVQKAVSADISADINMTY